MNGEADKKNLILGLLNELIGAESPRAIKAFSDRIKKLIGELSKNTYEAKGKIDWPAALEFLKSTQAGFRVLHEDLRGTFNPRGRDDIWKKDFDDFKEQLSRLRVQTHNLKIYLDQIG